MNKVSKAWVQASSDLQIQVKAPFILELSDGRKIKYIAFIQYFGSEKGTLVLNMNDMSEFSIPEKNGYYCSALNSDFYQTYIREEFIDTLEDWGFYGNEDNKPNWYTGKYYKEK